MATPDALVATADAVLVEKANGHDTEKDSNTTTPSTKPSKPWSASSLTAAASASSSRLSASTAQTATDLDDFLRHLHRCMETPAGIDAVLGHVCYSSRFVGLLLAALARRHSLLHRPARQLVAVARLVLPTRAVPVLSPSPLAHPTAARNWLAGVSKRLLALASLMTDARMMLRLWGLLGMYVWARQLVQQLWKRKEEEKQQPKELQPTTSETLLGWTQLASCIAYQVAENAAYLASKGVLPLSPALQGKAWLWSSRSFSVFVVVELGKMLVQKIHTLEGRADSDEKRAAAAELDTNLVRYASLGSMMAHYSSANGLLDQMTLCMTGLVPAAISMQRLWKKTAE